MLQKPLLSLARLAGLCLAIPIAAAAQCLPAEPTVVPLRGVLERVTFAGPPNYQDIAQGDRPETYFVLRLKSPVCLSVEGGGEIAASRVQLLLRPEQFVLFRPSLGHEVTLPGSLWPAQTGHHHTPLMFTPATTPGWR
jgi:hypothetical protein